MCLRQILPPNDNLVIVLQRLFELTAVDHIKIPLSSKHTTLG
jgi:hypothetical protein